jgi:HK97 gp10 family phage protein
VSKSLVDIKGFEELRSKLIKLGDDKSKTKAVRQILGKVANSTVKAAKNLIPIGGKIKVRNKTYNRKKRQVRKVVVEESYTPGMGQKSIGKKMLTRARNPMLVVRANDITVGGKKKYGGFYIRQFLQKGTKNMSKNLFMNKAYDQTQGQVTAEAEKKVAKYIQKQIDKLS